MNEYPCSVVKVVDGDTVKVVIDLGFHVDTRQTLRLARIDAPEVRGGTPETKELGRKSREFLTDLLIDAAPIYVHTIKDRTGKYGRYIAELYGRDANGNPININDTMVVTGHAKLYGV